MIFPFEDLREIVSRTESLWNEFRGKNIFLSGGTGFVGRWLLESFLLANKTLKMDAKIFVLSRDPGKFLATAPHLKQDSSLIFISGDIRQFDLPETPIHFAIHAAMDPLLASKPEQAQETVEIGYLGTKRVIEVCRRKKLEKFLYISSGAVYGAQPESVESIEETYAGSPDISQVRAAYGESKRMGEWLSHWGAESFGFEAKIARCFAFVGPGLPLDGPYAVGNFIRDVLGGEDIVISGDGTALRSYMHAIDMTVWLWHILVHGKDRQAYNVGSEEAVSMYELAKQVIALENPALKVEVKKKSSSGLSGSRYVPSTKLARSGLGLTMNMNQEQALRRTIDFYKKSEGKHEVRI